MANTQLDVINTMIELKTELLLLAIRKLAIFSYINIVKNAGTICFWQNAAFEICIQRSTKTVHHIKNINFLKIFVCCISYF